MAIMLQQDKHIVFSVAAKMIQNADSILVSGHMNPDGDSLGCMLALARILTSAGHATFAAGNAKNLGAPGFLDGVSDLVPLRRLSKKRFDLLICVDCGDPERMPQEVRPFATKIPVIVIDHHVTSENGTFGDVRIVDAAASSAGEIVWRFIKWMGLPFDRASAEALWVSLITDSGRFAYDSTCPGTLLAASDLLTYGVRTARINDILYCSFPPKSIELKKRAWRSLHVWKNRKVAEVTLTREDFREVHGSKADAEDAIEIPRSVTHNEFALFFYQLPGRARETRVSIRTRAPWDATLLAKKFGGGGHVRAAGCTVKSAIGTAKRLVRAAVTEMMRK